MGRLRPGESKSVIVRFENNTGDPITILQSSASRGCTAISMANDRIASGDKVEMSLRLIPGSRLGEVNSQITFLFKKQSDDDRTYRGMAMIKYDVCNDCAMPAAIIRCVVSPGKQSVLRIPVDNHSAWNWHDCRVFIEDDGFQGNVLIEKQAPPEANRKNELRESFLVSIPITD